MLLIASSAETGGILFGVAFLLCALLVFTVREIDIKTRARITPPQPKENAKSEKNGEKEYYIVKKKSTTAKKKTKQTI